MVHTFSADGTFYLFDNASGALHICDALTAEVVKKRNGEPYDLRGVKEEDVKEIEEEIAELEKQGVLFAEEEKEIPAKSEEIKALCLHICHDCNLRCEYCFAGQGNYKGRSEYMSFEVAKAAVDFLIANSGKRKILETDFFGGEPLMNLAVVKQTVDYAKAQGKAHGKKFLFTLTTNGVLLDEETARYLNEEMENVVLSIDGRKEVHDGVRKTVNGKGSYDVIIENITRFVKMRGDRHYYVRGTFTKKNLDFGNDVLYLADKGLTEISLEPVVTDENSPLYISEEGRARRCGGIPPPGAGIQAQKSGGGETLSVFPFPDRSRRRPVSEKTRVGVRRGQRIFFRHPFGRHLSLPPVRRPSRI